MVRIAGGIAAVAVVALTVAACGTTTHTTRSATTSAVTSRAAAAPTSTVAAPSSPNCYPAPAQLVADVNETFTGGEHLEHAQAINGPNQTVYVGGNIFDASGQKVSSQDTWVEVGGLLFSITSDARRRTVAPDGRHLAGTEEWPDYNAEVNECVGAAERAANSGG